MIPVLISSALISALVSTKTLDYCEADEDGDGPATKLFAHPYAFQLFGIVFGYLSVARLNISYARYWEGVTQVRSERARSQSAASRLRRVAPTGTLLTGSLSVAQIKIMHSKWADAIIQILASRHVSSKHSSRGCLLSLFFSAVASLTLLLK